MKALFVIAHGSRISASNEEIQALVEKVQSQATHYDLIEHGFLELAKPSITEGLIALIKSGATSIRVLPYFLVAGNHVVNDIPAEVDKVVRQYPAIDISIAPYFGSSADIAALLLSQIN